MASEKKKGFKVRYIVLGAVLLLIIAFVIIMVSSASMMGNMIMAQTSGLEKKDLENRFSVSGIVESATFKQVSANLAYNVDEVNVEVGDKVKAGDILAVLNSDDLQRQIVEQQANLDNANVNTDYSLSDAEKRYNEARAQIADGTYPEIRSAKLSLDNAQSSLSRAKDALENARDSREKAESRYEEQKELSGSDKQTRINTAQKNVDSAKYEMDCAEDDYNEAVRKRDEEDYSDIKELKKAYDDAKKDYDSRYTVDKGTELAKAREDYERALSNYSYASAYAASNASDTSAQTSLDTARKALTEAETKLNEATAKADAEAIENTYEKAMDSYNKAKADIDTAHDNAVKSAERAYNRAKSNYETAVDTLKNAEDGTDMSLDSYKDAADNAVRAEEDAEKSVSEAQKAVDDAQSSYDIAVKNANSSLSSLKAAADREKVLSENDTGLISLEMLKERLDDCIITAPCDGTVTAVYATPGAAAAGVMFIIEDTDNLKMTATVKEYNISELKEGLEVTVSIPSLGNREYEGMVSKIAPTGVKGPNGKSDGSASFDVEVVIRDTKDTGLLIGMTSKCTAVTGSKENVFAVGYDALVEDSDGSSYIYIAEAVPGGNGTATVKKIPVETGFETDAEIEIISDELTEGVAVINNSGDVSDGALVILADQLGAAVQAAGAGDDAGADAAE
ncbi:MAG: efflux RND transporter periplasmic adaptor subunit [Ruminococcus sp.]|nr:efflux RND transporter periplasmic adaptor subunit [Ruminococcus sp.]